MEKVKEEKDVDTDIQPGNNFQVFSVFVEQK